MNSHWENKCLNMVGLINNHKFTLSVSAGFSLLEKTQISQTNQEDSNYPACSNFKGWIPTLYFNGAFKVRKSGDIKGISELWELHLYLWVFKPQIAICVPYRVIMFSGWSFRKLDEHQNSKLKVQWNKAMKLWLKASSATLIEVCLCSC